MVTWFSTTFAKTDHCRNDQPEDSWILRTAITSQSVLIPCELSNVSVLWRRCRDESSKTEHVTINGAIANNLKDRFRLEPNGLLIDDVQPSDAGRYICREKHHSRRKRIIRLSVPLEVRHVQLGASIVLNCRSVFHNSMLWFHGERNYVLYWNNILKKDSGKFKLVRPNLSQGIFDLSISNVQFADAGKYRCLEHAFMAHPGEVLYKLIVSEHPKERDKNRSIATVSRGRKFLSHASAQLRQNSTEYPPNGGNDQSRHTNLFLLITALQTVITRYAVASVLC